MLISGRSLRNSNPYGNLPSGTKQRILLSCFYVNWCNITIHNTRRRNCVLNIKNEFFCLHKTSANPIKDTKYQVSSLYRCNIEKILKIFLNTNSMTSSIAGVMVFVCRHVKSVGCLFVRLTENQANISLPIPRVETGIYTLKFGRNLYRFLWTAATKTIRIIFLTI